MFLIGPPVFGISAEVSNTIAAISVSGLPVRGIGTKIFSPRQVYGNGNRSCLLAPSVEIPNIKATKTAKSMKIKKKE